MRGGPGGEDGPYVVVGTGNPGPEYRDTRHNAGFWCIDRLAARCGVGLKRAHRLVLLAEARIEGRPVVLVKPRTFVNASGLAAAYLLARFRVGPERFIAIADDTHLPPGVIRVRPRGSAGGHRGLKSIAEHIGTSDFARVRIGVGAPADPADQVEYVLSPLPPADRALVNEAVERAADAVGMIVAGEIAAAMNAHN